MTVSAIDFRSLPPESQAPRMPEPQPTHVPKYAGVPDISASVVRTDSIDLQRQIDSTFGVGSILDIKV